MFTMDLKGKHSIITHLTMQCLERYAKGFYCVDPGLSTQREFADWLNDLDFHGTPGSVCGERPGTQPVDVYDLNCYRIGNPSAGGMALLARSPEGVVCCAGGLSLTLIAEWVLYMYLKRYAGLLGDCCSDEDMAEQLKNMRERVEVVLETNSAIRCCTIEHFYAGYVTVPRMSELSRRKEEEEESYKKRFQRVLREEDLYTVSGTRWAESQKFYRFSQEECSMKVYMIDQCYSRNNHPVPTSRYPSWLRQQERCMDLETPSETGKGWKQLSDTMGLEEGALFFTPVARLYTNHALYLMPGDYRVLWHETEGKVDCILMVRQPRDTSFFGDGRNEPLRSGMISSPAETFVKFWRERPVMETVWKAKKDSVIGLSSRKECPQSPDCLETVTPKEGVEVSYLGRELQEVRFSNIPKKDFRVGLYLSPETAMPEGICLCAGHLVTGK